MVTACVEAVDDRDVCKDAWLACEDLSHLIFLLIAQSPQELQQMLSDVHNFSRPVGFNMHLGKVKLILNNHTSKSRFTVNATITEEVGKYVYLGETVMGDGDLLPEIKRCIALGWADFCKVGNIMRSRKADTKIKRKVLKEYIISVMICSSETWALATAQVDALAVAQRKMKCIMLNITLRDRNHNTWIRQQTGVAYIIDATKMSKHQWGGHIARLQGKLWTIRATDNWLPRELIRLRRRQ